MKLGRPSIYTEELAQRICAELSAGKSLRTVCKEEWAPSRRQVFQWLSDKPDFAALYTIAKEESADLYAEEILEIADNVEGDAFRDRLRVDARKWIAAKMKPKKYGDKVEHSGSVSLEGLIAQSMGK